MVIAVRRWCGGVSPVSSIRLLLAVLVLLLTSGKAVEPRTQSNENVASFEDAQHAAKVAMDRINKGMEATEPEVRNNLWELDALKLNEQISSSGLPDALEKLEGMILGLEEHLSDVGDKKVQLGEIINELIPDSAEFLPEELRSGEHSIRDVLTMLRYYKDTLKNMIYLMENPGAYEEALEEVSKLLEDGLIPEELDDIEAQFKSAASSLSPDFQNLTEEMKAAFASLQDKTEDVEDFEAMLQESLSYFANDPEYKDFEASALNGQKNCKTLDGDHSDQNVPKKGSAWAEKV